MCVCVFVCVCVCVCVCESKNVFSRMLWILGDLFLSSFYGVCEYECVCALQYNCFVNLVKFTCTNKTSFKGFALNRNSIRNKEEFCQTQKLKNCKV